MDSDAAGGLITAHNAWNSVANRLIVNFCAEAAA